MKAEQACRQAALCAGGSLSLILLSGCAEFQAARERTAQGWREARAVQIAAGASIKRSATSDCRREVGGEN